MSELLASLIEQRDDLIDRREHLRMDLKAAEASEMPVDDLYAAIRDATNEISTIDCQIELEA